MNADGGWHASQDQFVGITSRRLECMRQATNYTSRIPRSHAVISKPSAGLPRSCSRQGRQGCQFRRNPLPLGNYALRAMNHYARQNLGPPPPFLLLQRRHDSHQSARAQANTLLYIWYRARQVHLVRSVYTSSFWHTSGRR
jgi:hypothetical protein